MSGDISKHFSRWEFACECNCGFDTADYELIIVLEDVREHFDSRVAISSGCRCLMHNTILDGAEYSKHMWGQAADIVVMYVQPIEVYKYLDKKYPDKYGIGDYNHHTHIDVRPYIWRDTGMKSK